MKRKVRLVMVLSITKNWEWSDFQISKIVRQLLFTASNSREIVFV